MAEAHEMETSPAQIKTETLEVYEQASPSAREKVSPEDDDILTLGEMEKRHIFATLGGI